MYNPRLKSKESLVDMSTYGTDSRKRMHSTVLIGDHCEYHPMFKEGDILDANATLNLIQDTYNENKIFETFSEEGRQIAERLDRIESISDENNTQIVNEITEIDNKFSAQTESIRADINSIQRQIPELNRLVDISLVSNVNGKKTYRVEKQDGQISYIEISDGEKGDPFVYNDFTQEQLDSLKVKGDKGDKGDRGISVIEVKQTKLSYADKGENIWRLTLNDGTISEFVVRNGSGAEYVGALEQGISTESSRAQDAEQALQTNINALTVQQQQDVQQLNNKIDTKIADIIGTAPSALDTLGEIATKLANNDDAVASIVSSIAIESDNRQQTDEALQTNINTLSATVDANNLSVNNRIGTEETRAAQAEQRLTSDLATLSGIVDTNNIDLQTSISTEQDRAEAAETAINQAITQEIADRQTAVSNESTRAQNAESTLQSNIDAEQQRSTAAETALDGKIDQEISDRQAAISALSSTITANKTAADGSISDLSDAITNLSTNKADKATTLAGYNISDAYTKTEVDAIIQAEEDRAEAAEQSIADDLSDETTRATTAEQGIVSDLQDEVTRATTAEQTNATAIQSEVTRATTAEQANATAISANEAALQSEIARATAAEQANAAAIQANATAIAAQINKSEMGSANGVATLDANGIILESQIPQSVKNKVGTAYGVCSTESNVAEKTVVISDATWQLKTGSIIGVKYMNTNTADVDGNTTITLNVNSTGAKSILYNGVADPTGTLPEVYGTGGTNIYYMYDGTYWVWLTNGFVIDTKNTTGATNTNNKIYLVGATSQGDNPVTYSKSTVYADIDGCLYSDGEKVLTQHQDISGKLDTSTFNTFKDSIKTDGTLGTTITSAERTSWNAKVDSSSVGVANGIATLDNNGKVPTSQLPSYVDDVLEYADTTAFPQEGESGKIYVTLDTNKTYRWGGSNYAEISASLVIGTTSGTACEGNDSRLSDARPASDVYSWAKQQTKPVYTPDEVGQYSILYNVTQDLSNQTAPNDILGVSNTGKSAQIIYKNAGSQDYSVTISTSEGYITPTGSVVDLLCPAGGYCEISYLNINGTIFVRGLL